MDAIHERLPPWGWRTSSPPGLQTPRGYRHLKPQRAAVSVSAPAASHLAFLLSPGLPGKPKSLPLLCTFSSLRNPPKPLKRDLRGNVLGPGGPACRAVPPVLSGLQPRAAAHGVSGGGRQTAPSGTGGCVGTCSRRTREQGRGKVLGKTLWPQWNGKEAKAGVCSWSGEAEGWGLDELQVGL